ncbi:hypothetical protein AeRB84_009521, partial [Aphanomyces euteiches]
MAKVQDPRCRYNRVQFNRASTLISFLYIAKLVAMPFLTYITEPFPWGVPETAIPTSEDFDLFNNRTFAHFEQIYNNQTWTTQLDLTLLSKTNTYAARLEMNLSSTASANNPTHFSLIEFPGAIFYGKGLRSFAIHFAQDATQRSVSFQCQHTLYFGRPSFDSCVWFEPLGHDDMYSVYFATVILDTVAFSWSKLRYYTNYIILKSDLRTFGVLPKFIRYEIVLGDPTCLILSDPFLSFVFVVDIWLSVAYGSMARLRSSQLHVLGQFLLACFYLSRNIWTAYFGMRCISMLVKKKGWEAFFIPLDPGLTAMIATFYFGPIASMLGSTPFITTFQIIQDTLGTSPWANDQTLGVLFATIVPATIPIIFSLAYQPLQRWSTGLYSKGIRVITTTSNTRIHTTRLTRVTASACNSVGPHSMDLPQAFHQRSFNDLKNRIIYFLMLRKLPKNVKQAGGSLYALYTKNPSYRSLPLFSHRAADCFVLCFTPDGEVKMQLRL